MWCRACFRSLLIDIFGSSYPEKEFFKVNRNAVARWNTRVYRNVPKVCERIEALLGSVGMEATLKPVFRRQCRT